ncbi:alpha/beta fold hydrolase [bacterium]
MHIPERDFREINGIDISYLSRGGGTPFLMIHGLMSNALDFCFQFEEFGNRFSCIAPDIRGSGMSETPDPDSVSLEQAVDDMLEFITAAIPIDRQFVLLGHSFGGIISLELLRRIPERIRGLVIVSSPAAIADKVVSKIGLRLFKIFFPFLLPLAPNKAVIDFYSSFINMNPLNLTPDLKLVLRERNNLIEEKDLISIKGYFSSVPDWYIPSLPEDFDIPAALIYGDRDPLFSKRDITTLDALVPNLNIFKVKGTGHSCMMEKHAVFNSYLNEFFARYNI